MTTPFNNPPSGHLTIEAALATAYTYWNNGQAQAAEHLCRQVLAIQPAQADALHLLALIAHADNQLDLAISFLRQACLDIQAPAFYFSNLAEMCRQKGLLSEAETAAQQAVKKAPALVAAWNNLGIILQESGKPEASLECLRRVIELQPNEALAHNNLANTYRRLHQLEKAEEHYRRALALNPNYAEVYSNLAFLLHAQGQYEQAATLAQRAITINPHLSDAYLNLAEIETSRLHHHEALRWLDKLQAYAPQFPGALVARARILQKLNRPEEALACVRQALTLAPDNANAYNTLGKVLQFLNMHDEALAAFERAAALPGNVAEEALVTRAAVLMESGHSEEAIIAFEQALQRFPGSIQVMTSRSDTKKYQADDPDVIAMETRLAHDAGLVIADRLAIYFALGKAYLDIGNSERAFHYMNAGNQLKRSTFHYDANGTSLWLQHIAATFTPELMAARQDTTSTVGRSVFVIGMPRSGTTLVEQVLASHPQVHGAGELAALKLTIDSKGKFPDDVGAWSPDDLRNLGHDYLARTEPLVNGKDRLIDKMPANFLYAGLIPLILPGARIIHCRRDPVDTCLSCYSKQFASEQAFSYDLAELGRFHRDYQELMAHLRSVMPADCFIEVDYESVVDDLEGQARRLIDFIGLSWNDACLDFHKTRRVVRTASVAQVRQPIYATSKGRWHAHAQYLGPLLSALDHPTE